MLQRVPPKQVIRESCFELAVGAAFDRPAFELFFTRTGYIEDGIVDESGELVFRDDVIDLLGDAEIAFELGADVRVQTCFDILDETREAHQRFDGHEKDPVRSILANPNGSRR